MTLPRKTGDSLIDLHREAVWRYDQAITFDYDQRDEMENDLQFLTGEQWPEDVKSERAADKRPMVTVNRLPQFLRQVTGDIRRMNPAIRVQAADGVATEEVADVLTGAIRHIEAQSNASHVYEAAAESAAACGIGNFRIRVDWVDDSFDQECWIESIRNPFAVAYDPEAVHPTRSDANYVFVISKLAKDVFEETYPEAAPVDFDSLGSHGFYQHWGATEGVLVAEYFYKKPVEKTLGITEGGQVFVLEDLADPTAFVWKRTRKQMVTEIWSGKMTAAEWLEEPSRIPGRHIPIIAVVGEEIHVGDRRVRSGVIRYAKDAQRLYNYMRSAQVEYVALQPKAPFLATEAQIAGHESMWKQANSSNRPVLLYNVDDKAPGPPKRELPPVSAPGFAQEIMTSSEDMKATTGIFDAALGDRSNEVSGVGIRQRQIESDISTSVYGDNMGLAIQQCGNVCLGIIPEIYDTERLVRILGDEGVERFEKVNTYGEDGRPLLHLASGRYDVRVDTGPNYTTLRQEAVEHMLAYLEKDPAAAPFMRDRVVANLDFKDADEISERLKKTIPPNVLTDEERESMPIDPNARAQMAAQQQMEMLAAQTEEAKAAKARFDAQKAASAAEEQRFDTMKAQLELAIASGDIQKVIVAASQVLAQQSALSPAPALPQSAPRVNGAV